MKLVGILLFAITIAAQTPQPVSFEPILVAGPEIEAWKTAERASQGGTLGSWWLGGLTLCDLDGDSKPEILIGQHAIPGGMILKNTYPTFTDITQTVVTDKRLFPPADWRAHCRDFDKDGKMDIAGFGNDGSAGRNSLLNNWPDLFTRITPMMYPISKPVGDRPRYLQPAGILDLNGDSFLDVTDRVVEYIFNPSQRTFTLRASTFVKPTVPQEIQELIDANPAPVLWKFFDCCDVTGDGLADILLGGTQGYSGNHFSRLLVKQTNGSFVEETAARGLPTDAQVNMIEDVLGDALPELAMSRGSAPGLYLNNGGQFTRSTNSQLNTKIGLQDSYPNDVDAIDLNGDGFKEILIHLSNSGLNNALLFPRIGTGYAATPISLAGPVGSGPSNDCRSAWRADGVDVGDVDGDGGLDIVVGIGTSQTCPSKIVIWRNTNFEAPAPPQ